jgi:hypothetical protein
MNWIKKQYNSVKKRVEVLPKRAKELLRHSVGIPAGGFVAIIVGLLLDKGESIAEAGGATAETDAALEVLLTALISGSLTPAAFVAGIATWLIIEKMSKTATGEDEG